MFPQGRRIKFATLVAATVPVAVEGVRLAARPLYHLQAALVFHALPPGETPRLYGRRDAPPLL